jgi:tRNA threonylcarbamoyladenosine modification (KEOPS) complex  Pcc1 subunit
VRDGEAKQWRARRVRKQRSELEKSSYLRRETLVESEEERERESKISMEISRRRILITVDLAREK